MKRERFRYCLAIKVVITAMILVLTACQRNSSSPANLHNIVVITFDALSARYLDLYGFDIQTAPNLTAYANECHVFSDAISQSGSTSYSLGSLFTSRYPFTDDLIIIEEDNKFRKNKLYLPYVLSNAGYNTYAIVRDNYTRSKYGFDLGFDHFDDDFTVGDADETFAAAVNLLNRIEEPFFLWIHNEEPHAPYLPPEKYFRMIYTKKGIKTVYSFLDPSVEKAIEIFKEEYEGFHQELLEQSDKILKSHVYGRPMDIGEEELEQLRARYLASIRYADEHFGALVGSLKAMSFYPNTMVIISSDHGESLGAHQFFDHNDLYQDVIHVPLLVHLPGQKEKRVVNAPVELVDIFPTVTDLLGITLKHKIRGENLLSTQRKKQYQLSEYPGKKAWIRGNFKYICSERRCEYYDLSKDPEELQAQKVEGGVPKDISRLAALPKNIFFNTEVRSKTTKTAGPSQINETPPFVKRIKVKFPQLKRFIITEAFGNNDKGIIRLENEKERLKIEVTGGISKPKADKKIEGEIFQIKALYTTQFSPYPERITSRIECPQDLQPVSFEKMINGRTYKYLITYSNERHGLGIFSKDLVSHRVLIGWIYASDSRELFEFRYFAPLPVNDKIFHDFFSQLIGQTIRSTR